MDASAVSQAGREGRLDEEVVRNDVDPTEISAALTSTVLPSTRLGAVARIALSIGAFHQGPPSCGAVLTALLPEDPLRPRPEAITAAGTLSRRKLAGLTDGCKVFPQVVRLLPMRDRPPRPTVHCRPR